MGILSAYPAPGAGPGCCGDPWGLAAGSSRDRHRGAPWRGRVSAPRGPTDRGVWGGPDFRVSNKPAVPPWEPLGRRLGRGGVNSLNGGGLQGGSQWRGEPGSLPAHMGLGDRVVAFAFKNKLGAFSVLGFFSHYHPQRLRLRGGREWELPL